MADVNKKMLRVLKGFSSLDADERAEVFKRIKEYQENSNLEKRASILENFTARAGVDLGPTSQGGCPCCGK
jgi:hypothetical protein